MRQHGSMAAQADELRRPSIPSASTAEWRRRPTPPASPARCERSSAWPTPSTCPTSPQSTGHRDDMDEAASSQPTVEFHSPAGSCAESSWPIQLGRQPSRCRHGSRQRGQVHCRRCHSTLRARQRWPRHAGGVTSAYTGELINVSKATLTAMCILRTSVSSASHNRERAGEPASSSAVLLPPLQPGKAHIANLKEQ